MFLSDLSFSYFERTDIPARFFQLLDGNICVTSEYVYYERILEEVFRGAKYE